MSNIILQKFDHICGFMFCFKHFGLRCFQFGLRYRLVKIILMFGFSYRLAKIILSEWKPTWKTFSKIQRYSWYKILIKFSYNYIWSFIYTYICRAIFRHVQRFRTATHCCFAKNKHQTGEKFSEEVSNSFDLHKLET